MSNKVIYIVNSDPFESNAISNRIIAEIKGLIENGAGVELISLDVKSSDFKSQINITTAKAYKLRVKFYLRKHQYAFVNRVLRRLTPLLLFVDLTFRRGSLIVYQYGLTPRLVYTLAFARQFKGKRLFLIREIAEYPKFVQHGGKIGVLRRFYLKLLFEECEIVSVINYALRNFAMLYTTKPVVVVNMIVDPDRFSNLSRKNKNIVAYAGSLNDTKDGITNMLRAFSIFLNKQSKHFILKIYGKASRSVDMERFQRMAEDHGIRDYVHFEGQIDRDSLPSLLASSRLLLLCRPKNKQAEGGFPTKLGEYLATGVPVVVTDVGEIGCFIKDTINGFIAESDDPEVFADKMIQALSFSREIGLNGKKLIDSEFNPRIQMQNITLHFPEN